MLMLSGIPAADKNVCFRKRLPCYKDRTAANIHSSLLPLVTHYKGMLAHCKQWLEWLTLINFSDDHDGPNNTHYSSGKYGTF